MSLFGKGFFVFLSNRGFLQKVMIHENRHLEVSLPQCHHEVVILWVYAPPIPHPVPAPFQELLFSFLLRMLSIMNCIVILQDVWFVVCTVILQGMYKIGWSDLLQVMNVIWMICKLIIEIWNRTLIYHCWHVFPSFLCFFVSDPPFFPVVANNTERDGDVTLSILKCEFQGLQYKQYLVLVMRYWTFMPTLAWKKDVLLCVFSGLQ